MKRYGMWVEDVPTNATGTAVSGTGDDDSTVVVKKQPKIFKRKKRMTEKEIEEARNYAKERENYHSKPEQMERNAARLRARRLMIKNGKAARGDGKDVHHKDNDPLNNEEDNLKVTDRSWNRREPRLRKEGLGEGLKMNDPKLNKLFDELKKGDIVTLEYKAAMSSGKSTFKVTAKNVVGKARVEKVTLQNIKNPKGVKHFLYKRSTGVTFAQGDMGSQLISFKKEEIEESINIQERELTSTELKRREEIAKDLDDAKFKEKYGEKWKQVKMGVATNMAKKESIEEADDPKADKAKAKELKIAKAIAQAQLAIAKEQERVQKLTDLQNKVKDQQTEETIMSKKYLNTKPGSIEDAVKQVWQNASQASPAAPPTIETKEDEVEEDSKWSNQEKASLAKVDGRTKQYRETLKRIAMRKEKLNAMKKSSKKVEHVTDAIDEEDDLDEAKFRPGDIKKALKIAYDMEGNMTGAWKKIEKIKRGLGDDPTVQAALKDANEETIHEGTYIFPILDGEGESEKGAKQQLAKASKFGVKGKIVKDKYNDDGGSAVEVSGSPEDVIRWQWDMSPDEKISSSDVKDLEKSQGKSKYRGGKDMSIGEETIHEAVKGHFDAMDNKEMEKSLKKFRLKGKISQKNVNPGQDEWEVSGKSIEDIWKWYTKSGYGDADDFEDMDDFKDTHFESRVHHRARVTEGDKEEYQKFFNAALKKFDAKSPADMDDEKKKKFFNYIDKNWTKEEQQEFTEGELPPALKKAIAAKKAKNGDTEDEDKDPVGKKESWKKDVMKKPASGVKKGFKDKKDKKEEIQEAKTPMDVLRKIVDEKQHGKVSETKVDLFSASAMVKVFDQLSAGNKLKVEQMLKSSAGVNKFAEFAMANMKK